MGIQCKGDGSPDIGGGPLGGSGGNTLHNNALADLVVFASVIEVFAEGNAWDNVPPTEYTGSIDVVPRGTDVARATIGAAPATVHTGGATLAP